MPDSQTVAPDAQPETTKPTRPTGTRLILLGFFLVVAASLVAVPVDPSAIVFSLPGIVLAGLAAFLARRYGTWAKVVALLVGVLVAFSAVAFGGFALVASFFDFVPAMGGAIAGLLMVVGSVAAILARDGRQSFLDGRERSVFAGAVGLVAVLAAVSLVMSVGNQTVDEADRAGAVEIVIDQFEFTSVPSLPARETTSVLLRNDDVYMHTFTSDALGIDEQLNPGDEVLVEVTPSTAGTFQLWCRPHAMESDGTWEGMVASLEIN